MRRWLPLFLLLLAAPSFARIGMVDVNRDEYPDTSLADFSFLVPAPAGKSGFVTTKPDGHFYFADGTRARFWGINVSSRSIPQSDAEIDATCERFRRAGMNMLRLEAPDNVGMLLDTEDKNTSRKMRADYLDRMHRWMWAAKKNGIYTYLQLLDFRTFKEGDGVPNAAALGRAAKPYAYWNPRLIELQKEYARQMLETVNPYTKLKPIEDPSVAVIELANEHGLFIKGNTWTKLVPPHDKEFQKLWNDWLKDRYKTTEALDKAWTSPDGKHALQPDESLEKGNIVVPDMSDINREERAKADWTSATRSPARLDDGARFAYDVQARYFNDMKRYLHGLGVKVPITAVGTTWIAPDVKSVADTLDFTAENWYWDHPNFEPGKDWQAPFYYANKDPLANTGAWNAAPFMAALRWKGKPVFIREWAPVWPNEYRAAAMPLLAAYAAYQDIDGMLAFGYQFTGNGKVGDFNFERDPVRWGLMGLAAALYLRPDVQPADGLAELVYDDKALFTYQDYLNDLYRIAWVMRLQNVSKADAGKSGALISIPAQPADPDAELVKALDTVRTKHRMVAPDLSDFGLLQGMQIMALNTKEEMFSVVTPHTAIVAGRLSEMSKRYPGLATPTPFGALWMTTLDGKALEDSDHYLIKMVSIASNTGQQFAKSDGQFHPDRFALKTTGSPPILTGGKPSDTPTRFTFTAGDGEATLEVGMINGTWEVERNGNTVRVACDTPGVRIAFPGAQTATAHLYSGQTQPVPLTDGGFVFPKDTARVELTLAGNDE